MNEEDKLKLHGSLSLAQWAKHTLDEKLKFGLDEAQAVYRRETRVKAVLKDIIKNLEAVLEEKK